MEQPSNGTTVEQGNAEPSFLQDFAEKVKLEEAEILSNPHMREHFESHGASRRVRPGNFSDFFRMDLQTKVRAAEGVLKESNQSGHGTKEDFHKAEALAKFVEFYREQERFFALYAEARDDEKLRELALAMENEMPLLKETYEKYMKEFTVNTQEE